MFAVLDVRLYVTYKSFINIVSCYIDYIDYYNYLVLYNSCREHNE